MIARHPEQPSPGACSATNGARRQAQADELIEGERAASRGSQPAALAARLSEAGRQTSRISTFVAQPHVRDQRGRENVGRRLLEHLRKLVEGPIVGQLASTEGSQARTAWRTVSATTAGSESITTCEALSTRVTVAPNPVVREAMQVRVDRAVSRR
jgi:hypothetical protein